MIEHVIKWADAYFAPETGRLDSFIAKVELLKDFNISQQQCCGMMRFSECLSDWAQRNAYIINPSELCDSHGRIISRINIKHPDGSIVPSIMEMIYVWSTEKRLPEK